MRTKLILALTGAILLFFVSCKKDSSKSPVTNAITGNYTFVSVSAVITSTTQLSQGGVVLKTTTVSDYTTIQNAGNIRITGDSMSASGLTYTVDTTLMVYEYQNNQLLDSFSYPFYFNLPPTNSGSKYRLISNDSIYYEGGGFISPGIAGTGPSPVQGSGGKYVFSGNNLILTSHVNQNYTDNSTGTPVNVVNQGISTSILQKQ
jgi:hypothetical protein